MTIEDQLKQYLLDINQTVRAAVDADADIGANVEDEATRYFLNLLESTGEIEAFNVCTHIRQDKNRRTLHKVNGYAVSEGMETIDLFVTWFEENNELRTLSKADAVQAANQTERFLKNVFNGYVDELEESSDIYQFAYDLSKASVNSEVMRTRVFILSNGRYLQSGPIPERRLRDITIQYHVWDLDRFFRLHGSKNNREPIEIDLINDTGHGIPCLVMPSNGADYTSYLAIIPGTTLASLYERYGARLLEQNVRSFLQFGGKINKGIRETIRSAPERFLAYNNGISATATAVKTRSSPSGLELTMLTDLQIVNGGQTTVSIAQTKRQDKADLSRVFVQVKLTVINDEDTVGEIVPLISRYANSQNLIKEADLSSNSLFNRELERLSRLLYTPAVSGTTLQTRWFFERARGQYKEALNKELTAKGKRAFETQNPTKQKFDKESVSKAMNTWRGKPFMVARGGQKNYANFVSEIKSKYLPDQLYYRDLIAILILLAKANELNGSGKNAIGQSFIIVPYTISALAYKTKGLLDLDKIWQNQAVSEVTSNEIHCLLKLVENHLLAISNGKLKTEVAKREECWTSLKEKLDSYILSSGVKNELLSEKQVKERQTKASIDLDEEERKVAMKRIRSIGGRGWNAIRVWGQSSGLLSENQRRKCDDLSSVARSQRDMRENEIQSGISILDLVALKNPGLLLEIEIE